MLWIVISALEVLLEESPISFIPRLSRILCWNRRSMSEADYSWDIDRSYHSPLEIPGRTWIRGERYKQVRTSEE